MGFDQEAKMLDINFGKSHLEEESPCLEATETLEVRHEDSFS